ncbi:MAG: serine hydrolase [Spirochaetota bacterium]
MRTLGTRLLGSVLLLATALAPAVAQQAQESDMLRLLVTADEYKEEWFSDALQQQLNPLQLQQQLNRLLSDVGELEFIDGEDGEYSLFFEEAIVSATIVLDERGQVNTIWFRPPAPRADSFDDLLGRLRELPGETALLVVRDGERVAEHNADTPLSVASAFKLAVLAAAVEAQDDGSIDRSDVAYLNSSDRTLPTGIMQEWPEDTAVTVDTLMVQMMSMSDNTATDALMRILGRERVDEFASEAQPVVPTTREMFTLLGPDARDLADEWAQAESRQEFLALLERTAARDMGRIRDFTGGDLRSDVGWVFTAAELASFAERVAGAAAAGVTQGAATGADWSDVVYKDGYVPGVAAEVVHGRDTDGRAHTIVLLWNREDADVDVLELYGLIQTAVRLTQ